MCQYPVVQYMEQYQKYVPVSSCTVHDNALEIYASILLYSTLWNIRNMREYLVVQYTMKHQKYEAVSSCTVHCET